MTDIDLIMNSLLIGIKGLKEELLYDPNTIVITCAQDPNFFNTVESDGVESPLSGKPALHYITCEAHLHLTGDEIYRLTMRALTPVEYLILSSQHKKFFEIHDDFYDPLTGTALQPKI